MVKTVLTDKKKGIIALTGFALVMAAITIFAGKPIIAAVSDPEAFRLKIHGYGWAGRLIFLMMMFIQTVIAFIPGEPMEIAAGYAFGAIEGTLLCMAGQTAGSICVFLFVKKLGMKPVRVFVSEEKINSMRFLKNEKKLNALIFFVFFLPGTPKDALCYFVGLTPIRLSAWILISAFARIPSIVTSTIGGNALGVGRVWMAVIVFAATMIVSITGYMIYSRFMKKREARIEEGRKQKIPHYENTEKESA